MRHGLNRPVLSFDRRHYALTFCSALAWPLNSQNADSGARRETLPAVTSPPEMSNSGPVAVPGHDYRLRAGARFADWRVTTLDPLWRSAGDGDLAASMAWGPLGDCRVFFVRHLHRPTWLRVALHEEDRADGHKHGRIEAQDDKARPRGEGVGKRRARDHYGTDPQRHIPGEVVVQRARERGHDDREQQQYPVKALMTPAVLRMIVASPSDNSPMTR